MPYPHQFIDPEVIIGDGDTVTIPLTTGSNYYNGDIRVVYFTASLPLDAAGVSMDFGIPDPWGVEFFFVPQQSNGGHLRGLWVVSLILDENSEDDVVTCLPSPGATLAWWGYLAVTIHNWYPAGATPFKDQITSDNPFTPIDMPAITASGPGAVVGFTFTSQLGSPLPAGATPIADSGNSGAHYISADGSSGAQIWGKRITAAGSTGATTMPLTQATHWSAAQIFLPDNPDVVVAVGTAVEEADTAGAVTPSLLDKVTVPVGTAVEEVDTAGQVFSPLTGYRVSNPILLPGDPIIASDISWEAVPGAPGSTVTVKTSIDNGATWQEAVSGKPIPRLLAGNTSARSVLTRTSLTRKQLTDPTPRAKKLEVQISADSAKDEMVPLGLFVIEETAVSDSGGVGGGRYIEISGADLSRAVSARTWEDVFFIDAHTNYADAIREIISNRLPGTQFNFVTTEHETPRLVYGTSQDNDPWQDALDLATAIGYELYFDPYGVCTLRPVPDPAVDTPVWEFTDAANPTITELTRTITAESTFNVVVVTGEGSGLATPVQATAEDDDPASATYVEGPYGRRPVYFTSPAILTVEQAQDAANALLLIVKGASENVELEVVPNPALEPGDVVSVNATGAKIVGTFLLNQLTIPLAATTTMSATVFRQS